jgi:hypothetical protein
MMADKEPPVHPVSALSINARLTGELLDLKYDAMLCQESQIGPLLSAMGPDNYRRILVDETFRAAADEPAGT